MIEECYCAAGEHGPKRILPHSLKEPILHITHYDKLAIHRGWENVYYLIRSHFFWPALSVHYYAKVRSCSHFARNRIERRQNGVELQLVFTEAPPELACIDILGDIFTKSRKYISLGDSLKIH